MRTSKTNRDLWEDSTQLCGTAKNDAFRRKCRNFRVPLNEDRMMAKYQRRWMRPGEIPKARLNAVEKLAGLE
jgi:hypothetical protein